MMIYIEQLRMRLPAGFEHRAASIARQVGKLLATQSVSEDLSIDSVSISPQQIRANSADEEIAQMIAVQIIESYAGGRR